MDGSEWCLCTPARLDLSMIVMGHNSDVCGVAPVEYELDGVVRDLGLLFLLPPAQVGSGSGLGGCRASCKSCEQCTLGDEACYVRNRESGGFLVVDDAELAGQI